MAKHADRGLKRKCQNEACALPFYDLNRTDYACPNCGAAFDLRVLAQAAEAAAAASARGSRKYGRVFPIAAAPVEAVVPEAAEEAETEDAEVVADPVDASDVILEEEDEGEGVDIGPLPAEGIEE